MPAAFAFGQHCRNRRRVWRLLESHSDHQFDAIVTGSSEIDMWVRIFMAPTEGRLESGPRGLEVGQQVRVKLVSTNVER